jgi:L-ribulose-5-phosphate 3-epimerase
MDIPFQLGIMTDEVSQNIEDAIRLAKEFGLTALELRSIDGLQLHQIEDQRIEEIYCLVEKAGLTICGLSTPVFKCHLDDPKEIAQSVDILKRDVQLAKRFGTKLIRGFSFWSDTNTTFESVFPSIVKELRSIIPILEENKVVFALEFDPAVYATNAYKVALLVKEVDSPFIRALYDPGNDLWDPDGELPYPDGYVYLKDYIGHIHLKDAMPNGDKVEAVAIGTGLVDYRGLFGKLLEDSYKGYMVVETHYRLGSKLTEEQLKRPAGYLFSEGGEEASRQCLGSLFQLLKEVVALRTSSQKGGSI